MAEVALIPNNAIRNGQDLVLSFSEGGRLEAEVANRQLAAQEALDGAVESTTYMVGVATVLRDEVATEKCAETILALRDHDRAAAKLDNLNRYVGAQVTGKKVVIENISKDTKPVSVYSRSPDKPLTFFGRPVQRHRAAGTIIGLDLSRNELIVKPRRLTPRGILKDYWRVAMIDTEGEPLVHVELAGETRRQKDVLPALSRQFARIMS